VWADRLATHGPVWNDHRVGRLRLALALVVVGLLVAPVAAWADGDGRVVLRGTWTGTLIGVDPPITAHVRLGERDRIRFRGGIECRGTLTYVGRRGAAFRYRERITASASRDCVRLGFVHLTPRADGSMLYQWWGGGLRARAILRRS
jgi:hypothetical protein